MLHSVGILCCLLHVTAVTSSSSIGCDAGRGCTSAIPGADEAALVQKSISVHAKSHTAGDANGEMSRMKTAFPFYHTSKEIDAELQRLSKSCSGLLTTHRVSDSDRSIDVVTVRKKGSKPINRNFYIFGEHPRELIGSESALYFLRTLCGETELSRDLSLEQILDDNDFQLVVNANPVSRLVVENGTFCTRINPNKVDINRNWDEKFDAHLEEKMPSNDDFQVYPGPQPFSEPETRMLKKLVSDYHPTTFITVHSGTLGMYMPWAYDKKAGLPSKNYKEMLGVLEHVDRKHCNCPFGAAGKEVGYSCPGTSLDWVYDKLETPYSFAFEIYAPPEDMKNLRQRWNIAFGSGGLVLLQQGNHLAHPHFHAFFKDHMSNFVQLNSTGMHDREEEQKDKDGEIEEVKSEIKQMKCFKGFNPSDETEYRATVRNWASAYLDTASRIVEDLRRHARRRTHESHNAETRTAAITSDAAFRSS
eukprot:gnl/TRDRNA2_/TRDRNA2_186814_c0_seq1.p1 gnl/TRDRNA2_/TRDRNA2_186814_c0~~gnl/TRDRNA2_/TRDRNA2_186814_c0_seq1.p1  ORF type:complete len:475 (-),score=67.23 gnl/TRDRNA2_/TRDRNA2_186814_c0_seq1:52-1476(-)